MQFLVVAALVAAANSVYPPPYYLTSIAGPAPTFSAPSYRAPFYSGSMYDIKKYSPQPNAFNWAVNDYNNNDYSHSESSDGSVITGAYRVVLPDGRTQIVTYRTDSYGYNADVTYEGDAKYPEYETASHTGPAGPAVLATPVLN